MSQPNAQAFDLAFVLTGPPEQVTQPDDCPGFGLDLPQSWTCLPDCPVKRECYAAWAAESDPDQREASDD
jgi:hypothetical protein